MIGSLDMKFRHLYRLAFELLVNGIHGELQLHSLLCGLSSLIGATSQVHVAPSRIHGQRVALQIVCMRVQWLIVLDSNPTLIFLKFRI